MTASAGHVFVSHSSDNRELANELAGFIEGRGVKVWIAPRDVPPGKDYSEQLQLAIEGCAAFVILVTDMANKSPYVRAETEMAFSSHKPIFPVRISDIQPAAGLAFFLKIRHWTDAFGPGKSQSLDRLVEELRAVAAPVAPPAPAAPVAPVAASAPLPAPAEAAPAAATPEEEERRRAVVGPKAEYYLARWREMAAKNSAISWNWAACIANIFWFAYRKMWAPVVVLGIVYLLLTAVATTRPETTKLTLVLSIALSFVTGGYGNHLYRQQVARIAADRPNQEELRKRGGVSVSSVVVTVAAVVSLSLIIGAAAALRQRAQQQMVNDQFNATSPSLDSGTTTTTTPQATEPWQDPAMQDPAATDYQQEPVYDGTEGDKPTE